MGVEVVKRIITKYCENGWLFALQPVYTHCHATIIYKWKFMHTASMLEFKMLQSVESSNHFLLNKSKQNACWRLLNSISSANCHVAIGFYASSQVIQNTMVCNPIGQSETTERSCYFIILPSGNLENGYHVDYWKIFLEYIKLFYTNVCLELTQTRNATQHMVYWSTMCTCRYILFHSELIDWKHCKTRAI